MKQTPLQKALAVGWQHSSFNSTVLTRQVPYKTKETYYTTVYRNNDVATEHISQGNLQYLGKNSRVFKKLI